MVYDLIVVGAGPTGINIGVEAKKAGLNYLIIDKGMIVNTLYNFPANMTFFSTSKNLEIAGIPFISHSDKPTRREALEYYRRIVDSYDLDIHQYEKVLTAVKNEESQFEIATDKGQYIANNLVVATGFYDTPNQLNVPGEHLPKVKHYYDDAHPYVGQEVAIIGARNSACDVALETWQKGANVTMIIRGSDIYDGVKYWIRPNIVNRIKEGSIPAHFETEVTSIDENTITLKNAEKEWQIKNDFVLAMTGYRPDYDFFDRLGIEVERDGDRCPVFDEQTLESTIPHLYVAGVINAGLRSNKLFIENTREHAIIVVNHIQSR